MFEELLPGSSIEQWSRESRDYNPTVSKQPGSEIYSKEKEKKG